MNKNKNTIQKSRARYWLGLGFAEGRREVFRHVGIPTPELTPQFFACVGPFRTKRGAVFMRDHGKSNPHCQCVGQAERIAAGFVWDLVLRKWIKKVRDVATV